MMQLLTRKRLIQCLSLFSLCLLTGIAGAEEPSITALTVNQANGQTEYALSFKILMVMTALTVLPAILMAATSFTRTIVVLAIMRQALGMPNIPTNQIMIGLALFITVYIMSPVASQINEVSLQPYINQQITEQEALTKAVDPFKQFMLKQTRRDDIKLFQKLSKQPTPSSLQEIPMTTLMPAFITSELKTAFQMGFMIYLPFLVIDLVVASVLMSMGMMMLSPLVISLPFKILLFVMIDGWVLVIGTIASSFR